MSYAYAEKPWNAPRLVGLCAAIALNAGLVLVLANGLSFRVFKPIIDDIDVVAVPEKPDKPVVEEQVIPRPPQPQDFHPDQVTIVDPVIELPPVDPVRPPEGVISAGGEAGTGSGAGPAVPVIRELKADPRFLTKPFYPPIDIRLNHEGVVTLLILVTPDGRASQVKIEKSSGWSGLDSSAVREAMRKWRFIPQTQDGVAVAAWGRYTIRYHLD